MIEVMESVATEKVVGDVVVAARGLRKRFGRTEALCGVDLAVERGTVCGLLGPNGAGKTTVIRILTTLLRPDAGHAIVAGYDVLRDAEKVRGLIGLAGQYAAVDELLTGRANLEMVGRLYHMSAREARRRADELLERFSLTESANRLARTYSGGMRRRLDLAASLVAFPPVLFLDEPTTGLDPRSRNAMWDTIREVVADGTTVLLTTQYLEEADRLADHVAVIDRGRVVGSGSPSELKTAVGGEQIEVVVRHAAQLSEAVSALRYAFGSEPSVERESRSVMVSVSSGAMALIETVRALDANGMDVEDVSLRRPTLDEVFLQLTGHTATEEVYDDSPVAIEVEVA